MTNTLHATLGENVVWVLDIATADEALAATATSWTLEIGRRGTPYSATAIIITGGVYSTGTVTFSATNETVDTIGEGAWQADLCATAGGEVIAKWGTGVTVSRYVKR